MRGYFHRRKREKAPGLKRSFACTGLLFHRYRAREQDGIVEIDVTFHILIKGRHGAIKIDQHGRRIGGRSLAITQPADLAKLFPSLVTLRILTAWRNCLILPSRG